MRAFFLCLFGATVGLFMLRPCLVDEVETRGAEGGPFLAFVRALRLAEDVEYGILARAV